MYEITYKSNNGKVFNFNYKNEIVCDIDLGAGMSADIGTSQGAGQTGVTLETTSVGGKSVPVKGTIFENIPFKKQMMRNIFVAGSQGTLIAGNFELRVVVKEAPSFAEEKTDGRFTMLLFAPYPYFRDKESKYEILGEIVPNFRFPINYKNTHRFGTRSKGKTVNIENNGDLDIPLELYIIATGSSRDIVFSNLNSFQTLKINGILNPGEMVKFYRDDDRLLHCELIAEGKTTDILDRIADESTLYYLKTGDNLLSATDADRTNNFTVSFVKRIEVVAWYEY